MFSFSKNFMIHCILDSVNLSGLLFLCCLLLIWFYTENSFENPVGEIYFYEQYLFAHENYSFMTGVFISVYQPLAGAPER